MTDGAATVGGNPTTAPHPVRCGCSPSQNAPMDRPPPRRSLPGRRDERAGNPHVVVRRRCRRHGRPLPRRRSPRRRDGRRGPRRHRGRDSRPTVDGDRPAADRPPRVRLRGRTFRPTSCRRTSFPLGRVALPIHIRRLALLRPRHRRSGDARPPGRRPAYNLTSGIRRVRYRRSGPRDAGPGRTDARRRGVAPSRARGRPVPTGSGEQRRAAVRPHRARPW